MKSIVFVESKVTGGHLAFCSAKSEKPFTNNMKECQSVKLREDDVVVDIGAYVGEYALWASLKAQRVICYEATPETFSVLERNRKTNMEIFNRAVVGDDCEAVTLYLSKGVGVTNSVAKSASKAGSIEVGAIRYEKAIADATVVKIDVEGAEYSYNIVQPQLRAIILEFHPISGKDWRWMARSIMAEIEAAGFDPIMRPEFKNGWDVTGSWVRKEIE